MKHLFDALCGHYIEVPEEGLNKPVNYVMTKDGCFEVRNTALGQMTIRAEKIAGLKTKLQEGIQLDIPPIPGSLLSAIVEFFRAVYHERDGAEAFLQIFYNKEEDGFFLYCPNQKVSGVTVEFERSPQLEAEHLLVMDIHSHNSMPAFFSMVDDEDEKEDRLYGVVGCLHHRVPQMEFRLGVAGRFVPLDGRQLFGPPESPIEWPKEWLELCVAAPAPRHSKTKGKSPNRFFNRRHGTFLDDDWDFILGDAGEWEEDKAPQRPKQKGQFGYLSRNVWDE